MLMFLSYNKSEKYKQMRGLHGHLFWNQEEKRNSGLGGVNISSKREKELNREPTVLRGGHLSEERRNSLTRQGLLSHIQQAQESGALNEDNAESFTAGLKAFFCTEDDINKDMIREKEEEDVENSSAASSSSAAPEAESC